MNDRLPVSSNELYTKLMPHITRKLRLPARFFFSKFQPGSRLTVKWKKATLTAAHIQLLEKSILQLYDVKYSSDIRVILIWGNHAQLFPHKSCRIHNALSGESFHTITSLSGLTAYVQIG